jgi:hypothetical protein
MTNGMGLPSRCREERAVSNRRKAMVYTWRALMEAFVAGEMGRAGELDTLLATYESMTDEEYVTRHMEGVSA